MIEENTRLKQLLIKHEGLALKPYRCPEGRLTIGYGRNLQDVGITQLEAALLLSNDIKRVEQEAVDAFPWFKSINTVRQDVVLCMVFNLGLEGVKAFRHMIAALENQAYKRAAEEMMSSLWAKQVGRRASELAAMMDTGRIPPGG